MHENPRRFTCWNGAMTQRLCELCRLASGLCMLWLLGRLQPVLLGRPVVERSAQAMSSKLVGPDWLLIAIRYELLAYEVA